MDFLTGEGRRAMEEVAQETADRVVAENTRLLTDKIIPEVVKETMSNLGQDVSDKQEAQKDYHYLRKRRVRAERIEEYKVKTIVTSAFTVIVGAVIAYFKSGNS